MEKKLIYKIVHEIFGEIMTVLQKITNVSNYSVLAEAPNPAQHH
jgi:hypothetical protein